MTANILFVFVILAAGAVRSGGHGQYVSPAVSVIA